MDRCIDLVPADAAGILLADTEGHLQVTAASDEQTRLLELFQLQNEEGPCLEAFSTGQPVLHTDLASATELWPRFAPEATGAGYRTVHALPLRLRTTVIGTLNLFCCGPEPLGEADVRLAQALADVASIAILQDQAIRESKIETGQLRHALDSRVVIEQAKGMLSERAHVNMDEATRQLRAFARSNNHRLTEVAIQIVGGSLAIDDVLAGMAVPRQRS